MLHMANLYITKLMNVTFEGFIRNDYYLLCIDKPSIFHLSHSFGRKNKIDSKMALGKTWLKSHIGSMNPWPKETISKSNASRYIAYFRKRPVISKKPPISST